MDGNAFDFEVRVLSCRSCGAPVRAALGGGESVCTYCDARMVVGARPSASRAAAGQAAPGTSAESERIELLRSQVGDESEARRYTTKDAPQGAAALADYRSSEPQAGIDELEQRWRQAITEAGTGEDAAREAYWYAQILNKRLALVDEHLRRRAVLESSLDALEDPGYRHVIFTDLAAAAVRLGDVESGESWLAQADPAPSELFLDSTFRLAAARVRQARGDAAGVLAVLGDVPIHPSCDLMCSAYRIDALERTGARDQAWAAFVAAIKDPQWGKAVPMMLSKTDLAPGVLERLGSARRGMRTVMLVVGLAIVAGLAWAIFG